MVMLQNSWKCLSSPSSPNDGTPYLIDGCEVTEECARCKHNGGACDYDPIYDVNGALSKWNFTCYHRYILGRSSYLDVILGVSISMGVLFLVTITYISYKVIKRAKERRRVRREKILNIMVVYF